MNNNRIAGAAQRPQGSVREAIGNIYGGAETQRDAAAKKTAASTQNAVGGTTDIVRDVLKPR